MAEEYEIAPLNEQQEQQLLNAQKKSKETWWKKGKEVRLEKGTVQRLGDTGDVTTSLRLPDDAIVLADNRKREFVGYRVGTKVYIVDETLKASDPFDTSLRSNDECVVGDDGGVYILRWGFKTVQATGMERSDPPAGFAVYDSKGRAIWSETEDSGWEVGSLAGDAFVVFKRTKSQEA
ncbi:MAG TPA: hypothetical protein VMZ50_12395, partial [Phycisphaerae bacterium]|nr:hypothetical protein [Phycisphaerae bacterium]